ncbi:MAG: hypothetical protein AB1813_06070 [Verrucomicrobiota bacterium]
MSLESAVKDELFPQPVSVQYSKSPELAGAKCLRLAVTRDGIVYAQTTEGLARAFENQLALDRSFRPLAGKMPLSIGTHAAGNLYYLFPDKWLSNADAGKPLGLLPQLPQPHATSISVNDAGQVLVVWNYDVDRLALLLFENGNARKLPEISRGIYTAFSHGRDFYLASANELFRIRDGEIASFHKGTNITTIAFRNDNLLVGTSQGYYGLKLASGEPALPRQTRLPCADIRCLAPAENGLWAGTSRGVFFRGDDGQTRYFASKRWLDNDEVMAIQLDAKGDLFVLTQTGLNKIEFRPMTLAQKAAQYERKIRQRHIRFGFCSELRMLTPGDITSAEMIDTDNDGTWSNYYMASQAFHYGATGSEEAQRHAWETFTAFERLLSITGTNGFIARTFERRGFKFSDPDRWRDAADPNWEWKGHTSSDEIIAHTFGSAVMWECVAKTESEKQRIAKFYDQIIGHIVRNNFYLIDVDGEPTLWGRWNPEYVNWYPHTIGDRRLNSAEIIAMLQFAYKVTGKELYRAKAFELLRQHGYLENIRSSLKKIAPTAGYVFRGNDMGNEWNHSDDLLAFVAYWVLHRFAFDEELRAIYREAIRDHWEMEKAERNPIWNFVYASTGAQDADVDGAVWILRHFPLDLRTWRVTNSHREDITRMPANFRGQELAELLPPDERPITRWNTQSFILDGGDEGRIEFAGDEFLLPYWMGRYLKWIE